MTHEFPIRSIKRLNQVASTIAKSQHPMVRQALSACGPIGEALFVSNATALATAIAEFAPELAAKPKCRIAIVSFEGCDAKDRGRWFQLAAPLLGRSDAFEFDFVVFGPRIAGDEAPSPVGHLLHSLPGSDLYRCSVAEYISRRGLPDALFACHLNLVESDDDLLELEWIPNVLAEGARVMGWAFSPLERDLFCQAMRANGWGETVVADARAFGTTPVPDRHPFEHGRYLWQIKANSAPSLNVNRSAISALLTLARRHGDALDRGVSHPWCGRAVALPDYPAGVVFSVDDRAASLTDGTRLRVTARPGAAFPRVTRIGEAERWTAMSLAEATLGSPVQIAQLADAAFAQYLFPKNFSVESALGDEAVAAMSKDWEPELADGLKKMTAMMRAKTGVDLGIPLFVAADRDDADAIRQLSSNGAPLDQRDASGRTPLITAVCNNATRAVQVLLELGADIEGMLGFNRMTPAQLAITHGALESLLILLKGGANIDQPTVFGVNLIRDFLESGQGGSAIQVWYRDGIVSGRIPRASTATASGADGSLDDSDLLHTGESSEEASDDDAISDCQLVTEVVVGRPVVLDSIGEVPIGAAAGSIPSITLSRIPSGDGHGSRDPDRVWQIELSLQRRGTTMARLRVLLIECIDSPYGYLTIDDAEDWSSTLHTGIEVLAPLVEELWGSPDIIYGWIGRVVELDLSEELVSLEDQMSVATTCLVLAIATAEDFTGQSPHMALDDCPDPRLAQTPDAPERRARRQLLERLGAARVNPVDHAMFTAPDGAPKFCPAHPWVYILPFGWPNSVQV